MMKKQIFIIFLLLLPGFLVKAQSGAKFVNYDQYPDMIMEALQKKQEDKPFDAITVLKERCGLAKESVNIGLHNLSKPTKKKLSNKQLIEKIKPSVLMVCKYKRGFGAYKDFILINASAFALSEDGVCVSNYHVFESMINQGQGLSPQDSLIFMADMNGNVYPIETVLTYNKSADLVVFKLDVHEKELVPVSMGEDGVVGDMVHALTNPSYFPYYYSKGVIARNAAYNNNPWENRTEITADFAVGSSGGPIFDDSGNLIAIVSSTQGIYAQSSNQGNDLQMVIKMAIHVSSLKKLVLK